MLLMVDALRCTNTMPSTVDSYNAFVDAKRPALNSAKYAIQAHFVKQDGADKGIQAFTDYETRLGNELSSPNASYDRCAMIGSLARMATAASAPDLQILSSNFAKSSLIASCPRPAGAAGPRKTMVIPVWKTATPADPPTASEAAAASGPPQESDDPAAGDPAVKPTPAVMTSVEAAPTASPAVAPSAAAAPKAAPEDAATALQQAAAALAQAAAALKQEAPPSTTTIAAVK
ncbi:MAG: hypothetical protein ACTHMG_16700 [Sphingomonas sp.]